jgi:hypothetical protein
MRAPSVIPQLILNLCTVSIATCNKIFNQMTPFNGDRIRPRVTARAGGKTFSWLFDTGASVTCMTAESFNAAFPHTKPRRIQNAQHCTAASGNQMNSLGIFEIDLQIKGKSFKHSVNVIDQLTDNIIGIDFMHKHKLHYDVQTRQVKIAGIEIDQIVAIKEQTLPALASTVITAKYKGKVTKDTTYIASIFAPKTPTVSGMPAVVSIDKNNNCKIIVDNCAPYDVIIDRNDVIGFMDIETEQLIPMEDSTIAAILHDIDKRLPKVPKKKLTRQEIAEKANLNVPNEFKDKYVDILYKHQKAISANKYDLGLASNYKHKIHLKDNSPVYRKQFKIPEAHQQFIEQSLEEWLKLGVVKRANSLYNSPIFCVPKKQGQGLRVVQDFRELNNHSHIDKYSMKEITECIGDIGRANSTVFSTLDLTSGFWQMQLDEKSQPLTAFTIPGKGQYNWITSPMGLLGCPASFQRLMEGVMRNIANVIVYIDDLLVHTKTHEEHLKVLEQVLQRLHTHNLKINLDKCFFGNKEVSYLGFTLTPAGIKPGKNKLKAIKNAKPPTDVKSIRSFVGLCNFFRTHIKNFAIIAAPLFKLTRKDSGYKGGPLPKEAMDAFSILKNSLTSEPVMAFPRADRQYALITDAATGTADTAGGLGAILTQKDEFDNFYAISYASRQLKDHEKNYSPFLLEAAAAVWGMDVFNEYLKGKKFILYTDHKPLEKMGHLHTKTMNRLQAALLEHDFVIQYKKGEIMPADYLSRLPSANPDTIAEITQCFDPFQSDLIELQKSDADLQKMNHFRVHGQWPPEVTKSDAKYLQNLAIKLFQDAHNVVWIRLDDYKYPRTALYLPEKYRKMALCEAHNNLFGGHNAALKTYIRISSSYYWPKLWTDILNHTKTCLRCQKRKKSTNKPPPLQPLPLPERPNIRIHADLFGPMLAAGRQHKYILCITDAFTKYALVTAVENKEAETVAQAIFNEWFCKFGIPAQIHTDGGKEFVNKLSNELFTLLNVQHTKTTPAHPQCNAQVEVFNKTVKKYLASFVDDTTLDWENFLPALMLSYNTSYHSTIATTPFELLFGERPRLPSFPNPEIQRLHYGESSAAERYQLLQKIRFLAKNIASEQKDKIKDNFDKNALPHEFKINDLVWFEEFAPLGKNPKLTPKWQGPAKITEVNDTNAKVILPNGKTKIYNIMRLKKFFAPSPNENGATNDQNSELNFKEAPKITGPITRAMKKLLKQKEATEMAINVLCDLSKTHCSMCEWEQEFSDNPLLFDPVFARRYIAERKSWLINKQSMCARCKLQFGDHLVEKNAQDAASLVNSASDSLQQLMSNKFFDEATSNDLLHIQNLIKKARAASDKDSENLISAHNNSENLINAPSDEIFLINESLREPLLIVANKILGRQRLSFDQLTPSEQKLWNSFENSDIYEFLTGEKDTVPEFCSNWLTFSAKPKISINVDNIAARLTPIPGQPQAQRLPHSISISAPSSPTRTLRERKSKIDYRALHLGQNIKHDIQEAAQGVKQKCKQMRKSVRKSAKATVTKLNPGAFSPRQQTPASAPSSPPPTSSSSWKFWPSK